MPSIMVPFKLDCGFTGVSQDSALRTNDHQQEALNFTTFHWVEDLDPQCLRLDATDITVSIKTV